MALVLSHCLGVGEMTMSTSMRFSAFSLAFAIVTFACEQKGSPSPSQTPTRRRPAALAAEAWDYAVRANPNAFS